MEGRDAAKAWNPAAPTPCMARPAMTPARLGVAPDATDPKARKSTEASKTLARPTAAGSGTRRGWKIALVREYAIATQKL